MAAKEGTCVSVDKTAIKEVDDNHVQLLPCRIEQRGPANISTYFTPYVRKTETGAETKTESHESVQTASKEVMVCSFRGYPLEGHVLKVPETYTGLVIEKKCEDTSEKDTGPSEASVQATFSAVTYWNWDTIPSRNDALQQALDWIPLAEALHSQTP
nr:EOG090X0IC1 [Triops cancriformis]